MEISLKTNVNSTVNPAKVEVKLMLKLKIPLVFIDFSVSKIYFDFPMLNKSCQKHCLKGDTQSLPETSKCCYTICAKNEQLQGVT